MELIQVSTDEHRARVKTLFWEYLTWANDNLNSHYDINFDVANTIEHDMATLDKFSPPKGRLLLAQDGDRVAGLACMKLLSDDICEVKRMYVRPEFQRQGIGRRLLNALIVSAQNDGYPLMRLDSSRFMTSAHALYRSVGFQEIDPYEGSEIPKEIQQHWRFFELPLNGATT